MKTTMLIQPNIRTSGLNSDRVILNQENLKESQKMVVMFGLCIIIFDAEDKP